MDLLRIKKPYDKDLDTTLEVGSLEVPAIPTGLYFCKFRKDMDGSVKVERRGSGRFELTRTERVLKKVRENGGYSFYRKFQKWAELVK